MAMKDSSSWKEVELEDGTKDLLDRPGPHLPWLVSPGGGWPAPVPWFAGLAHVHHLSELVHVSRQLAHCAVRSKIRT
jgi:hypothetical protein